MLVERCECSVGRRSTTRREKPGVTSLKIFCAANALLSARVCRLPADDVHASPSQIPYTPIVNSADCDVVARLALRITSCCCTGATSLGGGVDGGALGRRDDIATPAVSSCVIVFAWLMDTRSEPVRDWRCADLPQKESLGTLKIAGIATSKCPFVCRAPDTLLDQRN